MTIHSHNAYTLESSVQPTKGNVLINISCQIGLKSCQLYQAVFLDSLACSRHLSSWLSPLLQVKYVQLSYLEHFQFLVLPPDSEGNLPVVCGLL